MYTVAEPISNLNRLEWATVHKLLGRIQREYMSDVSLETYADQLNVSLSWLSRAFKHITGTNYIRYIVHLRLEKCKELLVTTDTKIGEIAELLRYQPSYLIRIFRRCEGMTPGQYRDKFKNVTV